MTRYVKHSYGLIVGSDNVFFLQSGPDLVYKEYRSVVYPDSFEGGSINPYVYGIDTPAQQLIWKMYDYIEAGDDRWGKYYINPSVAYWLNKNIGKFQVNWDARVVNHTNSEPVFFRRRNDAIKFVKFIKDVVKTATYAKD